MVRVEATPKGGPETTLLLLSAPDQEFDALRRHLELVTMGLHQVLQDPGREVSMVGNEGFIGTPLAAGIRDTTRGTFCWQSPVPGVHGLP